MSVPLKVLRENDAAKVLGISARTLQRLRLDGDCPAFVQLSVGRIGYTETALADWIESRTVVPTTGGNGPRGRSAW